MPNAREARKLETKVKWDSPLHPGEILRRRFFGPLGVSQAAFCADHRIDPTKFSRILRGKQAITGDTANELSAAFKMSPMFFMNLQARHDLAIASKDHE